MGLTWSDLQEYVKKRENESSDRKAHIIKHEEEKVDLRLKDLRNRHCLNARHRKEKWNCCGVVLRQG